jgi:hypothetical protein
MAEAEPAASWPGLIGRKAFAQTLDFTVFAE